MLRINYTTYDNRREQDTINLQTRPHVVITGQNDRDKHPYWYAELLLLFHLRVRHVGPLSKSTEIQRVNIAFVRWLDLDLGRKGGWKVQRLHRVAYSDGSKPKAFGFINPDVIVRGVHLIPAFNAGATEDYLGPSKLARPHAPKDDHTDWMFYYVGMYVYF